MEIITYALECEAQALKKHFKNNVEFINIGVRAKNLEFLENVTKDDHITNIGICAGKNIGNIYECTKVIWDKDYYPDLFNNIIINKAEITSLQTLANQELVNSNSSMLYDQEAGPLFKAASKYIGPHQISFLKVCFDAGNSKQIYNKKSITQSIEKHISKIDDYIEFYKQMFDNISHQKPNIDIDKLAEILCCSVTMKNRLEQLINYAQIMNIDSENYFNNLIKNNSIPTKSKKDSIKIIDDFEEYITGGIHEKGINYRVK